MDAKSAKNRTVSAHRLPVSLPLPRSARPTPQAAFITQLLGSGVVARETQATERYRLAEASDKRRMPVGYRKSVSA